MARCMNCGTELPDDFPLQPVDNGEIPETVPDMSRAGSFRIEDFEPGTFWLEPWCVPCTRPPIVHDGVMTPPQ